MPLDGFYALRDALVGRLEKDLVGPGAENELIEDPPITKYASAILYPRDAGALDPQEDVDSTDSDDETAPDPPVALANVRYPSSMGMTFAVDLRIAQRLKVMVAAGCYTPVAVSTERPKGGARRAGVREHWQREALELEPIELDLTTPVADSRIPLAEGLTLFVRVREPDPQGIVPVTLGLLNDRLLPEGEKQRDAYSFFQPEIMVCPEPQAAAFAERAFHGRGGVPDEEAASYRLLYRHAREFAVGHGCSVHWQLGPDPARAAMVRTTFTPKCELASADIDDTISMSVLADGTKESVLPPLEDVCSSYERWIAGQEDGIPGLGNGLSEPALNNLARCRDAARRMRDGLECLRADQAAWTAFRLMNEAMLQQRARTRWHREGRATPAPQADSGHRWRPFQIAFILQCLRGLVSPESHERNYVDLLWFPTGGGKTEAYLGLVAFAIFLRRLRSGTEDGVTCLMRYTLRLLTIQQFERAALLICCCESIRRARQDLGATPISIGLWVGQGATPNTLDEARRTLRKMRTGVVPDSGNPVQLHACPWCGTVLDHTNYSIVANPRRLLIACGTPGCLFVQGVPAFVVDEDIYACRPSLIIATVDKFAGMPWREQSAELFNRGASYPPQLGPDLVVQDELHLISGPLGTLTGLYETAVDLLAARDGILPKVVASTATIRGAGGQTTGLFAREVRQFPPPGLDARDSYFSVEAPRDKVGTRMYVGLTAPGTSHATLMVRAYACLLQGLADETAPPEVKDPYWTLVGYFNSLRVLGGARMQVQDDVADRMALLARQAGTPTRAIDSRIELTSREPSGAIPSHLSHMAVSYPAADALDVILATNMISVGMDIDRLGLMAVMGQPQATSEYIQSTSRVGRKFPGLIVILLNAARSRDRSHYEAFLTYHSAIYRQVETSSVTPFAARARDRGLHAVLIALARVLVPQLRANEGASRIAGHLADVTRIRDAILDRVRAIDARECAGAQAELDEVIEVWLRRATERTDLVYRDSNDRSRALLIEADSEEVVEDAFPTLWSLRDVDVETNLRLVQ
jgi:hypothetical protein